MALKIATEASQVAPGAGKITSDRRLYLGADEKTLLEEGDAGARYLLVTEGGEIPANIVKQLGLEVTDGKVSQAVEKDAGETASSQSALDDAEAKQVAKPADKSRTAVEDKAGKGRGK